MLHLVMDEAIRRNRKVGILIIDLEAQYADTIRHVETMVEKYAAHIELHWVCAELLLRNAVSNFEPRWRCWALEKRELWVRHMPVRASDLSQYDFYVPGMEFEEFVELFAEWYSCGERCANFIGIRSDESLHRYYVFARGDANPELGFKWVTGVAGSAQLFNAYPIYDWRTRDIWIYHGKNPDRGYNAVYDKMNQAGVPLADQRLCQPFGDEQRRGLWLYHVLEPETWYKLIVRVNGANSGALYVTESGNVSGYSRISKPDGHTWQSFCLLLLSTMPTQTREHYTGRFRRFIADWRRRGYTEMPNEAPLELELGARGEGWAPSWRRMCRVLLRNDYWCKGLGQAQPKSEAYQHFKELRAKRKLTAELEPKPAKRRGKK